MPIAQQLTVTVANRPGGLARIAEILAGNKINIIGVNSSGPQRRIRLLVNNTGKARRVLRAAGVRARVDSVVVVTLGDRPGTLARTARKLARRKININYTYGTVARGGKRAAIVFGVANPRRAQRVL